MSEKSSTQDKGEGVLDKAKGKAKEAAESVSGDEKTKAEGTRTKPRALPRTRRAR